MFKIFVIGDLFRDITDAILGIIRDMDKGYEKETSILVIRPETSRLPKKSNAPFMIVCGECRIEDTIDVASALRKGMGVEVYVSMLRVP